jgi:hypothetical protein
MKVWEEKLAEEQACDLHSFDGQDLLVELEELHVHVVGSMMSTPPWLGGYQRWL